MAIKYLAIELLTSAPVNRANKSRRGQWGFAPLNWVWNAQAVSRFDGEAKSRAIVRLRKPLGDFLAKQG